MSLTKHSPIHVCACVLFSDAFRVWFFSPVVLPKAGHSCAQYYFIWLKVGSARNHVSEVTKPINIRRFLRHVFLTVYILSLCFLDCQRSSSALGRVSPSAVTYTRQRRTRFCQQFEQSQISHRGYEHSSYSHVSRETHSAHGDLHVWSLVVQNLMDR